MIGDLPPVRLAMTAIARARDLLPARLRRDGVLGLVFTPEGRIVLVRHSYTSGWYPPAGSRRRREPPEAAILRELREEIGLRSWSSIAPLATAEPRLAAFVLRDARYRPRWSLEIAAIATFDPDALPADASPRLRRILPLAARAENGPPPRPL